MMHRSLFSVVIVCVSRHNYGVDRAPIIIPDSAIIPPQSTPTSQVPSREFLSIIGVLIALFFLLAVTAAACSAEKVEGRGDEPKQKQRKSAHCSASVQHYTAVSARVCMNTYRCMCVLWG